MNGVIIIDKPAGWTSHDVVNRMRRILGQRSVGHLGTLDPLATGVLPLVTGSLTRLAQFYTASEKAYEGVIRFGFATNTYDADGSPLDAHVGTTAPGCPAPIPDLTLESIQQLAAAFQGLIEQVPPPFSAKKIHGVPAYKLARKDKEVILKPVQVEIKEFVILSVDGDRAHFRARVSSGTYMRSIAHDMGQRLGPGAHLESLRRTAVAEFHIAQALTIEEIETRLHRKAVHSDPGEEIGAEKTTCHSEPDRKGGVEEGVRHFESGGKDNIEKSPCHSEPGDKPGEEPAASNQEGKAALFVHPRQLLPQFPSVTADEATAARIRSGRPVNLPELSRARQVKVFHGQRNLIAIATRVAGTLFHPKIVFPGE